MNKLLINLSFGFAVFLAGAVMSDIFRWRPFGTMFAYSGLIYIAVVIAISLLQTSWLKRALNSKQRLTAWCITYTDPQYRLSTKNSLIYLGYGIAAYLIGIVLFYFLRWETFGRMLAYGSLIYIAAIISFTLYQASCVEKFISSIKCLVDKCNTYVVPKYRFWMNKTLIKLSSGIAALLLGVLMSEQLRWRTLGDIIAYGGLIYITFTLFQTPSLKKFFSSIKRMLAQQGCNIPDGVDTATIRPPSKFLSIVVLFVFPALLHVVLLAVLVNKDPCTGNPGCMAGSLSAFFFILISLPTILILAVASLVQVFSASYNNYRKYLKINTILSVSPFAVGFVGLALIAVFR